MYKDGRARSARSSSEQEGARFIEPPRARHAAVPKRGYGKSSLAGVLLVGSACADLPPIAIDAPAPRVTSESGASVRVSVSLARRPRGVVVVEAESSDLSEARTSDAVRFHSRNWRTPQVITISGVDDALQDGDIAYEVRVVARSSSFDDEPLELESLGFLNRDDDGARFVGLGDLPGGAVSSYASDLTPSGEVVVGGSAGPTGDQAVRWTLSGGLQPLDARPSSAAGVSADGTVVAGAVAELPQPGGVWRGSEPFVSLFYPGSAPEAPVGLWMMSAVAALEDGRVFGNCHQYGTPNAGFGCWTNRPNYLAALPVSRIYEVDEAGNYAGVTWPEPRSSPPYGPRALYNTSALPFPVECFAPHTCGMAAQDFSAGGAVIVGTSDLHAEGVDEVNDPGPLLPTAFMYTPALGLVRLADLPGGEQASGAYSISDDGAIIAGFGTDAEGQQAVVWIDGVANLLSELLASAGALPAGWQLREVRDLSADGRVMIGNGVNPQGDPEGFFAVLPESPLSGE